MIISIGSALLRQCDNQMESNGYWIRQGFSEYRATTHCRVPDLIQRERERERESRNQNNVSKEAVNMWKDFARIIAWHNDLGMIVNMKSEAQMAACTRPSKRTSGLWSKRLGRRQWPSSRAKMIHFTPMNPERKLAFTNHRMRLRGLSVEARKHTFRMLSVCFLSG